jgi:hypothetical protein
MNGDKQKNHNAHMPRALESYDYYVDEENNGEKYFTFETPDAVYTVYFNPNEYKNRVADYPLLLNNTHGFGFFQFIRDGVTIPKNDIKIRRTIENIICDFYRENPNAILLYHCYYADGKQHKRSKKFERWYNESAAKNLITKHEIGLEILTGEEYITHYIGYLISNANKEIDSVHKEFETFALSFPDDKGG